MYLYDLDWVQAERVVVAVLGLDWDLPATDQSFRYTWRDGYPFCKRQVYNRASQPFSPREHTRLRDDYPVDRYVTASPIHKDDPSGQCGDVAVSFDNPRNWAAGTLADAGYRIDWTWAGNTQAIPPYGRFVASDGWYLRVRRP